MIHQALVEETSLSISYILNQKMLFAFVYLIEFKMMLKVQFELQFFSI
jgi:hypothetical protein